MTPIFPTEKTVLVSLPYGSGTPSVSEATLDVHQRRAWEITAHLRRSVACHLTADGSWEKTLEERLSGALVFHGSGDLLTLQRLRAAGVPALFYPSFGPLRDGFFQNQTLNDYSRFMRDRLLLQTAHVVVVDSLAQAVAAQAFYDLAPAWLVVPGGPRCPVRAAPGDHPPRLWIVESEKNLGNPATLTARIASWPRDDGLLVHGATEEEILATVRPATDVILDPAPPCHAGTVLTWALTGAPVVLPRTGVVDRTYGRIAWLESETVSRTALDDAIHTARHMPAEGANTQSVPTWEDAIRAIHRTFVRLSPRTSFPTVQVLANTPGHDSGSLRSTHPWSPQRPPAPPVPRAATAPRVLWISDHPALPTGFGRVSREIVVRLSRDYGFRVSVLGTSPPQGTGAGTGTDALPGIRLLPCTTPSEEIVASAVREERPDVIVTLGDLWTHYYLQRVPAREKVPWIGYFTVDIGPLPENLRRIAEQMDLRVTASDFSAQVFNAAFPDLSIERVGFGVDGSVFRPLAVAGAAIPRQLPNGRTAFTVGCVARNQFRKNFPVLIEAFAEFSRNRTDAVLHLHTNPIDSAGWEIPSLLRRHQVLERTRFTRSMLTFRPLPDARLSRVLQSFDLFVLPTMGEGFGLPLLEAMACGIPVVTTKTGAIPEMAEGAGILLPPTASLVLPPQGGAWALISAQAVADAMGILYEDKALREQYGSQGRFVAEARTWDRCAEEWAQRIGRFIRSDVAKR